MRISGAPLCPSDSVVIINTPQGSAYSWSGRSIFSVVVKFVR